MNRRALLGLLAALAVPAPALALRDVIVGNEPVGPGLGLDDQALAAVNVEDRVYLSHHLGAFDVYFGGGPRALSEAFRRFAALPAESREIILMPVPAKPLVHTVPIPYDWFL